MENEMETQSKARDSAMVNLIKLKELARDNLNAASVLREILIAEADYITITAFLERLPVWQRLLRLERRS
jgi:hypothetical protein